MNSIDLLALTVRFDHPWLLFVLIPAFALMLIPYFLLGKKRRRTRQRIVSLVLHSVILVLCTLLLAGMNFHMEETQVKSEVILLVDKSDSSAARQEEMDDFIRAVLGSDTEGHSVGIVTFANGSVESAGMSTNTSAVYDRYESNAELPKSDATDIASALQYVRSLLSDPKEGRVIVLSDGIQTDGNALAVVKAMADEGTRVDSVYFSALSGNREALISSVTAGNGFASIGDKIDIDVITYSSSSSEGVLSLCVDSEVEQKLPVELSGGMQAFTFSYEITEAKLYKFSVVLETDEDTLSQNNVYYTYLSVNSAQKVLVVDGTGEEAEGILPILQSSFEVDVVTPDTMPQTPDGLSRYDEIIMMNVANADLPENYAADVLDRYVREYGGGLYTVGGDNAYVKEDMEGSAFENLLPVNSNVGKKTLGLLIIIDTSSSMTALATGGTQRRIDLAKEAAVASVKELDAGDYVGVLCFNSASHHGSDLEKINTGMLSVALHRQDVIDTINQIQAADSASGTSYYDAIYGANTVMTGFRETDQRHIIFMTDGWVSDSNGNRLDMVTNYVKSMYNQANHITLSTIALGPDADDPNAAAFLAELAAEGHGRPYVVSNETELKSIMVKETKTAIGQRDNVTAFTPLVENRTAAVAGIGSAEMPTLDGFYGVTAKEGATVVLSYQSNPIYAEWTVGLGRVGSFMCDMNGTWSGDLLESETGIKFLFNSINSLYRRQTDGVKREIEVSFVPNNFKTQVRINVASAGEMPMAELTAPDGSKTWLELSSASSTSFVGEFATDKQGVYILSVHRGSGTEEVVVDAYTTFSYSAEYEQFPEESESFAFMESLSENGNGKLLFNAENLFGSRNEVAESDFDPALTFLIICAVLFLLDIVVRKFKFKWIHELIRERKEKMQ